MANMDGIKRPGRATPRRVGAESPAPLEKPWRMAQDAAQDARDVVAPRTRLKAAQRRRLAARARKLGPGAAAPEAKPLARRRPWLERGQWPLIGAVALAAAYSSTIGQWLILAYAIFTLALRRDSREPFVGALILLISVPLFQILNLNTFENNAAIYAYELLVVGVVAAIIQLKFQKSAADSGA